MKAILPLGPALLLALQPAMPPAAAFSALVRCADSRSQDSCLQAETELKALIREQESDAQRQLQPRCLGALTQLESVLAVYRWRLENTGNLRLAISAAAQQCSTGSAGLSQ